MMPTTEKLASPPVVDDALERLHKRWSAHRDKLLEEGLDPALVLESFGTVAIASMIAGLGRLRSADVLLASYAEIKRAIVADEAERKTSRH